jgi:hypothetical protein
MTAPFPLRAARIALLVAGLAACGPSAPTGPQAAERHGLVLLPSDAPLAPGVEKRDERLFFHDFGRVRDGEQVAHVFRLRNEDPVDVSITRVVPGCGCTVPSLRAVLPDGTVVAGESPGSKAEKLLTVPPGGLAEIEISVDTSHISNKNVDKLVTIGITTDSPGGYFVNLEVHILVARPIYAVPESLNLGKVPENGGGSGTIELVPAPGFEEEVVGVGELPEGVRAELRRESRIGGEIHVLELHLEPPLPLGQLRRTVVIATEDAQGDPAAGVEIPIVAMVVPDLVSDPARIILTGPSGVPLEGQTRVSSLLAGHRLRVRTVEVLDPSHASWLDARVEPLDPDDDGRSADWQVVLRAEAVPEGVETPLGGDLRLTIDDPQHPTFTVGYAVHVR